MIKKELHSLKWSALYQILTSAVSYITLIILARKFEPNYYGVLIFGFNLVEFLKILSDPGITLYNISVFSHIREKKRFISQTLSIRIVLSAISFCLFLTALFFYKTSIEIKVVMLIFSLSLFPNIFDSRWIFQGSLKMNLSFFSKTVFRLLFLALVILAVLKNSPYYYIPYLFFLASFMGFLTSFPLILRYYGNFNLNFKPTKKTFVFLKATTPIGLIQFLTASNSVITIFLIGYLLKSYDVGQYGAAYKYSLFVSGILSIILNSLLPIISKSKLDTDAYEKYSEFYLNILILIIFSTSIPVIFYTGIIYRLIYGANYSLSSPLASVLTLANLIYAYVHFIGYHLISKHKQSKYTRVLFIGFVLNLFFLIVLIPGYGINGAGISMLISSVASLIASLYYYRKYISDSIKKQTKPLLSVMLSLVITFAIYLRYDNFRGLLISLILSFLANVILIYISGRNGRK